MEKDFKAMSKLNRLKDNIRNGGFEVYDGYALHMVHLPKFDILDIKIRLFTEYS